MQSQTIDAFTQASANFRGKECNVIHANGSSKDGVISQIDVYQGNIAVTLTNGMNLFISAGVAERFETKNEGNRSQWLVTTPAGDIYSFG